MTRWEYHRVVALPERAEAELNKLAADGWELVSVAPGDTYHHLYLKRQVTS